MTRAIHEPAPVDASLADRIAQRIRVLALIGDTISGPARQLLASVRALESVGVDLRIGVLRRRQRKDGSLVGLLERAGIPFDVVADTGPLDLRIVSRVRTLIDLTRADILQTHSYKASWVAWLLRRTGTIIPWIGFFHGYTTESRRARIYHRLDHLMLASADRVIAMSEIQRRALARRSRNVHIVHNAITQGVLPATPTGSPPDLPESERPRIAVIGRLSPEKGVDILLQALARLTADGRDVSAVIAGDGPERPRLETLVATLGLASRIRFLGHVDDPWPIYAAVDLVVIPSRSEGLPNVLLEALAADVPVVATRVGAVPDVLAQPGSGIIVEPGSVDQLAAGLARALDTLHSADARAARAATLRPFSLEQRARSLEQIYRGVVPPAGALMVPEHRAH